ncbi:glycosyltransferase [Oricola sp.]|uniref:glycosyltransferase n=1 Tax=Oricola sp. TaxID=1979950 RepID=UPI003BAAD1F5
MRVLHVFKTYMPETYGGIERVINSIVVGTAALGVESTVLSLGERTDVEGRADGHRALTAKRDFEVASTGFSRDFLRLLKQQAAMHDVINYHFPWPFMDLGHLMVNPSRKYVVTYHSDIVRQRYLERLYSPLMARFLGGAERIVATSPNYVSTSKTLQRYAEKVVVIPPGIADVSASAGDADIVGRWRKRFPRRLFIFTGMLRYYKGLEYLVAAARHVDADIAIVGTGPEAQRLSKLAGSSACTNVHFLGRLDELDKYALLSLCDGFVFPSHLRSEAYGISLVEAAMMGKPMITCEIGTGTSFINLHGETGLVIPAKNPEAIGLAMMRLLNAPDEAKEFGARARERFESTFSIERMAQHYAEIYRAL